MGDRHAELLGAFDRHSRFTVEDGTVRLAGTPFTGAVDIGVNDETATYLITVTAPSLDAVVTDQSVSEVILAGWAETYERRIEGADGVTPEIATVDSDVEWDQHTLTVQMTVRRPATAPAPTDGIAALMQFIEGTYLQGVIPGYEYGPPVDKMLERARGRAVEDRAP